MIRNFIVNTLRSIRKQKGYALITLSGLTVGITCFTLISIFVRYELSYDRFHEEHQDVYRVKVKTLNVSMRYRGNRLSESRIHYGDPAFLEVFDFPLNAGDFETAMAVPYRLLISRKQLLEEREEPSFSKQTPFGAPNTGRGFDGNKMLILTTPKYAEVLDEYIAWKIQRGLDVEVDVQSAHKGAETIQRKLQEKYDREGLTYIILVGDIDDVPSVMLPAHASSPYREEGYPSDPSYTLLEGDDLIGDALISRISVNTPAELANQLNKIVKYEKGDFENFDWIRHALVASMTGFDGIDHAGKLEANLKSHPEYFDEVIKIMDSDGNITQRIRDAIEKTGVNFIAHHGHGSETAFGSLPFTRENAAGLKNFDTGFPIIHGAACSTGSFWFEDGDCLAEAFMKAGNVEKPAGAIAFLGGATSMDPGACIAAQKEVFMTYYYDEDVETIGELFYRGTLAAMQNLSQARGERLFRRWHLFGDCSTPLWRKIPAGRATH